MSQNNSTSMAATTSGLSTGSSTPIRIGSYHGPHSIGGSIINQGASSGNNNMGDITPLHPQSSSVPSGGVGGGGCAPTAAPLATPLNLGSSNQSLVGGGAGGGTGLTPPNSAGLRQSSAFDFKFMRRTSLKVLKPKLSSTDSLSNSPGPASPGIANWATSQDSRDKYDGNQIDKTPTGTDASKLNRKESYKAQRKNYRREKKRVASELMNSLQDPAVIVLADWLKVRGTLKSWTKLWCVLKPGLLLIYKSYKTKSNHWVGTVLLTSCQVIERPSKKDGFCFKIFHPMEQSIWAPRGPDRETIGAVVQPLPTSYLIFRAPSQAAGKCWMDALELSLRCSARLLRSNSNSEAMLQAGLALDSAHNISHETQWSEADYEKHFNDQDLDADSQNEGAAPVLSGQESYTDSEGGGFNDEDPPETPYISAVEEEFNEQSGEQVEELAEENKSLIWMLVKQVRPGMDLSKVVLPTFILEPRSFLDKLSDSYYHADMLSSAVLEDDPFTRMKMVVKWYLSGFYKKPHGLKKPYNPILGETFRCYWQHQNGSRTYYIAEQVSHHPPISAFYVTNRQDGFCISCSILAKSKFYGNSTSAVLEGVATLTLLPRGESYTLTTPYAHCKGIVVGTLSMELGGKINIECEYTGYKTELEFKLKPIFGGSDSTNVVAGKIKLGKETLATISGHWDSEMRIKDVKLGDESILFKVNQELKSQRLTRYLVPIDSQLETESQRMWKLVSAAIKRDDQVGATEEKTVLEEAQRTSARERKSLLENWVPLHFQQDSLTGQWIYKYADLRPWDKRSDVKQYEFNYKVLTKTRHKTPMVRTSSIVSGERLLAIKTKRQSPITMPSNNNAIESDDSSVSNEEIVKKTISHKSIRKLGLAIEQVNRALDEHTRQLQWIQTRIERMQYAPTGRSVDLTMGSSSSTFSPDTRYTKILMYGLFGLFACLYIRWLYNY